MSADESSTGWIEATAARIGRWKVGVLFAIGRRGRTWMRYIVAWALGVPFSVIVLWYVIGHSACG